VHDDPLLRRTEMDSILSRIDELAELVSGSVRPLFLRYSEGPASDLGSSIDTESGLDLPGLSVNPLQPESWWIRPIEDWLARQICQYQELQEHNPDRFAWVLTGREVGRGPDCEPLLRAVLPVARLSDELVDEAARRYADRFDAGRGPEG
jgi:hypothetical protein